MTIGSERMTAGRRMEQTVDMPGTVSCTYFVGLLDFAVACGASRALLLDDLSISESQLLDTERRLPLDALRTLFEVASQQLGDSAFALCFGAGVPCSTLTLASALAAASPAVQSSRINASDRRTLRDALDGLNRYGSLGVDFGHLAPPVRFRFAEDDAGVWLEDLRPDVQEGIGWPALTESVFARFATGVRQRGGESVVRALEVTHDAPADTHHLRAYADVFRVPVEFGASRNALCLDPTFLERPLEPLPAPVHSVLAQHADRQMAKIHADRSWRARVLELLNTGIMRAQTSNDPLPNLECLCRELAVSRHTLHRRLRLEGTTFAALHADALREFADHLLRNERLPVAAVADRLGFSEAASFSRAYLRWTGARPRTSKY